MTRTNKTRRNPPGSLPDDAATGPGVKDDGSGEDSEVEATQVSVEAKTSGTFFSLRTNATKKCCAAFVEYVPNNVNNETIYAALKQSKDLVNESVMAMLDAFGQTNTETKQKASFVADRIGTYLVVTITSSNLRSLIATVGTGRGVSVLDFLCLNQQKESLLTVLTWFKERNLSWPHLQSLVIDKDFTEWLL
ncbi:hypothetical protein GQ600_18753 [Phytophthora cactorum]|nr:hypothetical protein GQ600_18753 [Phytophthora cactorum]